MKSASAALIALLDSQQFLMADLYTFTLSDGTTILRYTNADGDLVVSGNTFTAMGPLLSRGNTTLKIGTEVDSLDVMLGTNVSVIQNGISIGHFAQQGGFDGARLKLERVFMGTWGDTSAGTLIMFVGRVSDVVVGRTVVDITVNSDLELLNIMLPRNTYQAGCIHTLFDSGCGIVKSSFAVSGNTTSNSSASQINCNLSNANGYFGLGTITYVSGQNNGTSRTIKSYSTGNLSLSLPFLFTPSTGDTFVAYPGCDKTVPTCTGTFNNVVNFRGYPFIPSPETAH